MNRCEKLRDNGGLQVISFYGTGGLGKTRLAEKLSDEFAVLKISDVKFLFHDFINGTDMRLKRTANFRLRIPAVRDGKLLPFRQAGQEKNRRATIPFADNEKQVAESSYKSGGRCVDGYIPGINSVAAVLDITSNMFKIFPGIKTFARLAWYIDNAMAKNEHDKNLESHEEIRDEIYFRTS